MASTIGRAGRNIFTAIDGKGPTSGPNTPMMDSSGGGNPMLFSPKTPAGPPLGFFKNQSGIPSSGGNYGSNNGMPAHKPPPPSSTPKGSHNASFTVPSTKPAAPPKKSQHDRRDSTDSIELEKTLQEVSRMDDKKYQRPPPPRFPLRDSPTKGFVISPRGEQNITIDSTQLSEFDATVTSEIASLLSFSSSRNLQRGNSVQMPTAAPAPTIVETLEKASISRQPSSIPPAELSRNASHIMRLNSSQKLSGKAPSALSSSHRSMGKEELLAALAALKQQNAMLNATMQRKEVESQQQLESERQQRMKIVTTLEQENQMLLKQLLEAKRQADLKLQEEKAVFADHMKKLEEEKSKLQQHIQDKQQQMQANVSSLEAQRQSLEQHITDLEQQYHVRQQQGVAAEDSKLAEEMRNMEETKRSLLKELDMSKQQIQQQHDLLAKQYETDKDVLHQQVSQMEQERRDLMERLALAEQEVVKQQHMMETQLQKQQQQQQQQQQQKESASNKGSPQQLRKVSFHSTVSPEKEPAATFGIAVTVEETEDTTAAEADVDISTLPLQDRLRVSAERSKKRVEELTMKLKKRQKAKLKKNVNKMKNQLRAEFGLAAPDSVSDKEHPDGHSGGKLRRGLPSTKSLYDVMSQQNLVRHNSSSQRNLKALLNPAEEAVSHGTDAVGDDDYQILGQESMFHTLTSIAEVLGPAPTANGNAAAAGEGKAALTAQTSVRGKTVMDLDSDDDEDTSNNSNNNKAVLTRQPTGKGATLARSGASQSNIAAVSALSKATPNNTKMAMPDLPPAHYASAQGDIIRMQMLHSVDIRLLIDTVDSVNRYALFYAVAHDQLKAVEFILTLIQHAPIDNPKFQNTNNHFHYLLKNLTNSLAIEKSPLAQLSVVDRQIYQHIYTSTLYNVLCHTDVYGDHVIHSAAVCGNVKILTLLLETMSSFIKDSIQDVYRQQYLYELQQSRYAQGDHSELNVDDVEIPWYENSEEIFSTVMSYIVNSQNQLGLSPGHLAAHSDVLEQLHTYHANLLIQDYQQRSILFICCALDKASCVEYLVNSLDNLPEVLMHTILADQEDDGGEHAHERIEQLILSYVMQRDYRGDTPLHAAACNNSLQSLLILLQSGIDPRIVNDKKFSAFDLALKHGYKQCMDVLAEYTLHYCTSSEFDSVLFLKTLEGQRKITEYEKDNPNLYAQNVQQTRTLVTKKSMFSLKRQQTMRIQRYGDWIAYHDADTPFAVFWYNMETTAAQWETPSEVLEMLEHDGYYSTADSPTKRDYFNTTLQAKMSMKLKREGEWLFYTAEEGKTFYYNDKTGEFQWSNPFEAMAADEPQPPQYFGHTEQYYQDDNQQLYDYHQDYPTQEYAHNHNHQQQQQQYYYQDQPPQYESQYPQQYNEQYNQQYDSHYDPHGYQEQQYTQHDYQEQHQLQADNNENYYQEEKQKLQQLVPGMSGSQLPTYIEQSPWRPFFDDSSGLVYWFNYLTDSTQWENPFDHPEEQQPAQKQALSYANYSHHLQTQPAATNPVSATQHLEEESGLLLGMGSISGKHASTKQPVLSLQHPNQSTASSAPPNTGSSGTGSSTARSGTNSARPNENVFSIDSDDDEDEGISYTPPTTSSAKHTSNPGNTKVSSSANSSPTRSAPIPKPAVVKKKEHHKAANMVGRGNPFNNDRRPSIDDSEQVFSILNENELDL